MYLVPVPCILTISQGEHLWSKTELCPPLKHRVNTRVPQGLVFSAVFFVSELWDVVEPRPAKASGVTLVEVKLVQIMYFLRHVILYIYIYIHTYLSIYLYVCTDVSYLHLFTRYIYYHRHDYPELTWHFKCGDKHIVDWGVSSDSLFIYVKILSDANGGSRLACLGCLGCSGTAARRRSREKRKRKRQQQYMQVGSLQLVL